MPTGRPTKFKPEYVDLARNACLCIKATDEQLAQLFDVSIKTIEHWKRNKPEFLGAIKEGKDQSDFDVAKSLYHRANGMTFTETKTVKNGSDVVRTEETTKYIPPDTGAAMAWLKNRQPEMWRDRQSEHAADVLGALLGQIIAVGNKGLPGDEFIEGELVPNLLEDG